MIMIRHLDAVQRRVHFSVRLSHRRHLRLSMFARIVLSVALLAAQSVTGVPRSGRRIQMRELSNVPAACKADCDPFTPFLQGVSCPIAQCCTTLFEAAYFNCFKCVGTATNADFSIAQQYVDVVTTSCFIEGITLPELTFPGQNPNRTLATALPAGASTLPIFPSAAASGSSSGSAVSASAASQTAPLSVSPSATAPPTQSTVTSPAPAASSAGSAAPSAPSNSGEIRLNPRFGAAAVAAAVLIALEALLV
ncbi:hypothetical protein B0H10DRAFT_1993977 [Mycena sp. CBHHK59/15]|nr:hypothetical protein B0H10DRAFT_1993977 [Mycena sp. CBHHK59/15]